MRTTAMSREPRAPLVIDATPNEHGQYNHDAP